MLNEKILNRLVLGTAGLAGIWGKVDKHESIKTIHKALDMGIQHFDTAPAYADAESILSEALLSADKKDAFISTKVGKGRADNPDALVLDYSRKGIRKSVENSLRLFKRDVIDLLFLHDPVFIKEQEIPGALEELCQLKKEGKVKQLGIGGNYPSTFEFHALSGVFSHFMGFNRYNILVQDAVEMEFKKLKSQNLEIWQASPLYMGLLGSKYEQYTSESPEWISAEVIAKARNLKKYADQFGVNIAGMAFHFIMKTAMIDKMVLGASNLHELEQSLGFLHDEQLENVVEEFLQSNDKTMN